MKRFALVLAICMLLPLNAFALQPMSEDTMGQVTGQAGVSIAVDDIKMFQQINGLVYTDVDGVDGLAAVNMDADPLNDVAENGGSIGITNLSVMVNINAITHLDAAGRAPLSPGRAVQGDYTNVVAGQFYNVVTAGDNPATTGVVETQYDGSFHSNALTIDAGILSVLSEGISYNNGAPGVGVNITGVRIGLPTVEIVQSALTFDIIATSTGAANSGLSYGRIEIGEMTMAVLDGFVEIAPHN